MPFSAVSGTTAHSSSVVSSSTGRWLSMIAMPLPLNMALRDPMRMSGLFFQSITVSFTLVFSVD